MADQMGLDAAHGGIEAHEEPREAVEQLHDQAEKAQQSPGNGGSYRGTRHSEDSVNRAGLQMRPATSTGVRSVQASTPHSEMLDETTPALTDHSQFLSYLQSMACADPGMHGGLKNENWKEFIRRFKRKYERVIRCYDIMIEILGDDHLRGRAKSIFQALPATIKGLGFDRVATELERLLASDSRASRIRALTELRNLRIRPNQEVSEFCVTLEKLARQANPGCSISERSMECAQILLDNLRSWPEHVQLISALHKVDPTNSYEEIEELAISIEQSKAIYGLQKEPSRVQWRARAEAYDQVTYPDRGGIHELRTTRSDEPKVGGSGHQRQTQSNTMERTQQTTNGPKKALRTANATTVADMDILVKNVRCGNRKSIL
ncbi:hypothetical protein Aduo_004862 [Ancylostoma duodenale]